MSDDGHKLFILEARADSLRAAETYLRNRNWHLRTTTKVTEFLALVLKAQPQFVMICIDHPHPKAAALPKLIAHAFPNIQVIGFVNSASSAGMTILKNSGCEYTVPTPVSGTSVERIVLRILRDVQKKQEDAAKASEKAALRTDDTSDERDEQGNLIRLQGDRQKSESSISQKARQALTHFMQNSSEEEDSGPAYFPSAPDSYAADFFESSGGNGASPGGITPSANRRRRVPLVMGRGAGFKRAPLVMGAVTGKETSRLNLKKNAASLGFRPVEEDEDIENDDWMRKDPTTGAPVFESEWNRRDSSTGLPTFEEGNWQRKTKGTPFYHREESLIVKGTSDAMEKATIKGKSNRPTERIKKASRVACISVESIRFNGYLIAAFGSNRHMDSKFISMVRARLIEFMRAQGEEFGAEEGIELNLEEVEFEDWAMEQAEFLRKTVHDGNEVAMAFFPERAKDAPLEVSADASMLMVDLEELVGDATVEFDIYIYMPANKKYVLYTRQGQKLYGNQKDRLKSKGVEKMHLRQDDARDVSRYRVRNFLNDKIATFKTKKTPQTG